MKWHLFRSCVKARMEEAKVQSDDSNDDDIITTDPLKVLISESSEETKTNLKMQQHYLTSIQSTLVSRQLPSQGLSFQLWPAATTLVSLLDRHRRLSDDDINTPISTLLCSLAKSNCPDRPIKILELGSGTGLVGIAAAVLLSADVTVTDLPHVIPNLQSNVDANADLLKLHGGSVHVAPLRWGEEDDLVEGFKESFDLVLASDVVYHDHLYDPLLKTLRLMLLPGYGGEESAMQKKRIVFVMAHLRRWKKDAVFFKKARKVFDVDTIHRDEPCNGSRTGVVVYSVEAKQLHPRKD